jgi:CBS domain-containing protein
VELLQRHKISELPVIDANGTPVGLIDITDVIAFLPAEESERRMRVA